LTADVFTGKEYLYVQDRSNLQTLASLHYHHKMAVLFNFSKELKQNVQLTPLSSNNIHSFESVIVLHVVAEQAIIHFL
jgi:hypothetical protein